MGGCLRDLYGTIPFVRAGCHSISDWLEPRGSAKKALVGPAGKCSAIATRESSLKGFQIALYDTSSVDYACTRTEGFCSG